MNAQLELPTQVQAFQAPRELPLYATVPPGWTRDTVSALATRLDLQADVADAGPWFVCRSDAWTLEVYQASNSLRLERNGFDAEARAPIKAQADRDRAVVVAHRFLSDVGATKAQATVASVTELQVLKATKEHREGERSVAGLQVNFQYTLDGLWLVGPGAKAQVTVAPGGQIAQAYRFTRDVKQVGTRPTVAAEVALRRFAQSTALAQLPAGARVRVDSIQLGLLSLPPTEVQGVLLPAYVLRGEISTELLPHAGFISYLAAADLDEGEAKRQRWQQIRPTLLAA